MHGNALGMRGNALAAGLWGMWLGGGRQLNNYLLKDRRRSGSHFCIYQWPISRSYFASASANSNS
jgi:hypothetical protein